MARSSRQFGFKALVCATAFVFLIQLAAPSVLLAQTSHLPVPGTLITPTENYTPALLTGIILNPEHPLRFDFMIKAGGDPYGRAEFQDESARLIKYFLASLTVPEDEMWVNLSPHEQNRMVAEGLGRTGMGRDLLSQDYLLKQLTASLLHPDQEPGRTFWSKALKETNAPEMDINDFLHKIWIVPDNAVVYEHTQGAYVIQSHLTVMLEKDYLDAARPTDESAVKDDQRLTGLIREHIIPEIEKEVNNGKTFAPLRQMYHAMILATWYKMTLKKSLLAQTYVNRNKIRGIDSADETLNAKIYEQYMKAFTVGVYNFIREDVDPVSHKVLPRQYFSGGLLPVQQRNLRVLTGDPAALTPGDQAMLNDYSAQNTRLFKVTADLYDIGANADTAMLSGEDEAAPLSDDTLRQMIARKQIKILHPVNLTEELRNLRNEFYGTNLDGFEMIRQKAMTVYDFIDRIPLSGYEGGYLLGFDTWQHSYPALAAVSGLSTWQESFQEFFTEDNVPAEKLLEAVTSRATEDKPVFVLVPRDLFSHPQRDELAREMEWFIDNPDKTEHVHFVFGAYNTITPSDWNQSSLSAQNDLTDDQRQQMFKFILRHRADYSKKTILDYRAGPYETTLNAAVTEFQHSFEEYYLHFKRTTDKARIFFRDKDWRGNLIYSQMRLEMQESISNQTTQIIGMILGEYIDDVHIWDEIRTMLRHNYETQEDYYKQDLLLSFLDSVMSRLTYFPLRKDYKTTPVSGIRTPADKVIHQHPYQGPQALRETVQAILNDFDLRDLYETPDTDIEITAAMLEEQLSHLPADVEIKGIEVLKPLFYRNKAAYVVGRFLTNDKPVPLIIALKHPNNGVVIDAVVTDYLTSKNLLLSSTRSSFMINAPDFPEVIRFIADIFPEVSLAQIYDLVGLTQRSQQIYLGELYEQMEQSGNRLQYLGDGDQSITMAVPGSPIVIKVIRDNAPNRGHIVDTYRDIHKSNRHGQLLDSWAYSNVRFPISMVDPELVDLLKREAGADIFVDETHITFINMFAQRHITPVADIWAQSDAAAQLDILIKIGWNIKHLASMGIFPLDMSLRHFGITSWGRVVYMNNAGLGRIEETEFRTAPSYRKVQPPVVTLPAREDSKNRFRVYPGLLFAELKIPLIFQKEFTRIHGDLFQPDFWNSVKWRMDTNQLPDIFPYPNQYRLSSHRIAKVLTSMGIPHTDDTIDRMVSGPKLEVTETTMHGLKFLVLKVPNPRARILVVEPIGPDIISMLHKKMGNVDFDIIQPDSEIVEDDTANWIPGVRGKLKDLVKAKHYDYVLGYVNETFDQEFFDTSEIKGLILFSTGVHNIDLDAASRNDIVVTNAPGPTTVAVAEQNIGLMLDSIYAGKVLSEETLATGRMTDLVRETGADPDAQAQIIWYRLLQQSLKLNEMFTFATKGRYVRTGVGAQATVYHDQLGQNKEADIHTSLGILGLDSVGERLIEMAITHELSTIYVDEDEYKNLDETAKERFQSLIKTMEENKRKYDMKISIKPLPKEVLVEVSDYTIATPAARQNRTLSDFLDAHPIDVDPQTIFIKDPATLSLSLAGLKVGIQGLGRIGKAVAQRVIALRATALINQRESTRPMYTEKIDFLNSLSFFMLRDAGPEQQRAVFVDLDHFMQQSNIITTLTPLTTETESWIDAEKLEQFGVSAKGDVRAIVSQVKNLIDEEALLHYLRDRPDVEVRLDVVNQEEKGDAHQRFRDASNNPLPNIKVAGHTAAAVPQVRRLKVQRALDNLERLMNFQVPHNILNGHVLYHKETDVTLAGLKFKRMTSQRGKTNVLVVEPLNPDMIEALRDNFSDINFDIIGSESEVVEKDGRLIAGIDPNVGQIVSQKDYDFCVGYCNTRFDDAFFEKADLKGLVLFATAEHNIDLDAATRHQTVVTTAPGPTTIAVAEQNIALALDGVYGQLVSFEQTPGSVKLSGVKPKTNEERLNAAHIMWYMLLKKALKLDEMFEFGRSGKYAKTGVSPDSTVYHDQIGQNDEAGIHTTIGILGLQTAGVNLLETAVIHQAATIYVLRKEYEQLSESTRRRIQDLIQTIIKNSEIKGISINLKLVEESELVRSSDYILKTPSDKAYKSLRDKEKVKGVVIDADQIFIKDSNVLQTGLARQTFGVHGIRRIGTALAKRALAFGVNLLIDTESMDTRDLEAKHDAFSQIADNRRKVYGPGMKAPAYADKMDFFRRSNIVTTLDDSSKQRNVEWVNEEALQQFGLDAEGPVRVLINASKFQVDENALIHYAIEHPGVQIRLDVLNDEGESQRRFVNDEGEQLTNVKLSGHTAAAVWKVRQFKIARAMLNLRRLIDGKIPENVLNPEVLAHVRTSDPKKDHMMSAEEQTIKSVGGIDLNPRWLDLQIKRDDFGIPLPIQEQPLELMHIGGYFPVIIDIRPVLYLPFILGHAGPNEETPAAPKLTLAR
ncbi:MAG: isocitrate dehydrogenase kinase/phosphatase AceK regulatory subunit [Candidatus Omnitrophota bacterium]